jgi:tape measure domain-containing protein
MADNKIEIKVTADTAQAVTELGAVEKGLKATGTQAQQLGASSGAAGTALAQAGQGAAAAATQLDKVQASATSTGTAFAQIGPLIAGAFAGAQMVKTITEADSLQRGMLAVAGSSQAAATEMAFIRKTSADLGLELQSTGKAYLSLMAATKGTALEGQATREVFISVSRAMSALGRSTAETENALRAVSQIASKGTVSMEELRGQLGEALPGAMTAAAAGMGVTTQELVKMVESGGVLAKDLLPALTGELDKLYASGGQTDSLVANFNRFKNAVSEVSIKLGEAGLTKALADIAIVGAQAVGTAGTAFVGLGKF